MVSAAGMHGYVLLYTSITDTEPQLAANQDHLVRKIFSKFRRNPPTGPREGQTQSDVEKGDNEPERGKVSLS